jgi:hypothetical protein
VPDTCSSTDTTSDEVQSSKAIEQTASLIFSIGVFFIFDLTMIFNKPATLWRTVDLNVL